MKLHITAGNSKLIINGDDDIIARRFNEIVLMLIGGHKTDIVPKINDIVHEANRVHETSRNFSEIDNTVKTFEPEVLPHVSQHITPEALLTNRYTGFLYIQCESCRKSRGFNAKTPTSEYICECGHKTPLGELVMLEAACKCGKRWSYLTNADRFTNIVELNCISCGSPMAAEYNEKLDKFVRM